MNVIWSLGTGFNGDQALGVQLLRLGNRKRQLINGEPLPLSPKSYLSWLGFTAEGESWFPLLQPPGLWDCSHVIFPTAAPQELPALWTLTAWCGCSTAPWEIPGRHCATPGRRARVNQTTTGWSASTRTCSSSGDCLLFSSRYCFEGENGCKSLQGPIYKSKWEERFNLKFFAVAAFLLQVFC